MGCLSCQMRRAERRVNAFARLAFNQTAGRPKRPVPSGAAQCGACIAALLGIVGRATTFVARLASIRIEPSSAIVNTYAEAP